jgi:acyl-CoA synthetase (NDP forming)
MTAGGAGLRADDALSILARPQSVAIVGGSADASKISGRPVKFLRRGGFRGAAYLVNPGLPEVDGFVSVANVATLLDPPEVAFVALNAAAAIGAVGELAAIGTRVAVVLAAGFADAGAEGEEMQRRLVSAAGEMRLLGPNSLGIMNLSDGVLLSPSDALETPGLVAGSIGLASQSGGILASLLTRATARGIGFSKLISTGNEADLEISDCIEFFTEDAATSVIALYLETLRNPQRFLAAAQAAMAQGKRVVAYKVGRSQAGARAAVSHTGALAGSDRIYDALFEKAGVLRVARFTELLSVPIALTTRKQLRSRRVGVLTTTGGAGTLIADACGAIGMVLPTPEQSLVDELNRRFPGAGGALDHNPIDLTLAGTRPEVMGPMIEEIVASASFDAVVVIVGSSAVAQPNLVADPLIASVARAGPKPIFAYVSPHVPEIIVRLNRAGVPAFDAPEDCAAALAALCIATPPGSDQPASGDGDDRAEPDERATSGILLNEREAKDLLARFGIGSPRRVVTTSVDEIWDAALGLEAPYALKVVAARLLHKSDVGAVAVGVSREDLAQRAHGMLDTLQSSLPALEIEGFLVEEEHRGPEVLLGMLRDPLLGPAIVLGSGGIAAELIADTVLALAPVDPPTARGMIARLRMHPLLEGARGQPLADTAALADTIVRFSEFVMHFGERLLEAEINPLVVLKAGEGVLALDGLIRLTADDQ